jgi:hypothetical protein
MSREYLLAIAGACLLGAVTLFVREHLRRARYEPRHTAEQPAVAEHQGATEQWSPMADIGPAGPIDLHTQLTNAEAQIAHWQRAAEQLRSRIAADEAQRDRRALDRMEQQFRERLSRTGRAVHLEADTAAFKKSDIAGILAAAHRGAAR